MVEKLTKLDKTTVIPISLAVASLATIVGATLYYTSDRASVVERIITTEGTITHEVTMNRERHNVTEKRIHAIEQRMEKFEAGQKQNTERLVRIDENVRQIKESIDKEH